MRPTPKLVAALMVAALFPASADAAARTGAYAGATAQDLPVNLSVARGGLRMSVTIRWNGRCGVDASGRFVPKRYTGVRETRETPIRIDARGRFTYRDVFDGTVGGDGDGTITTTEVTGRFLANGTVSGTWRYRDASFSGQGESTLSRCDSGRIAFRARRGGRFTPPAPRQIAAGALAIGLPFDVSHVAAGDDTVLIGDKLGRGVRALDPATNRFGAVRPLPGLAQLVPGPNAFYALSTGAGSRIDLSRIRAGRVERLARFGPGDVSESLLAVGDGAAWLVDDLSDPARLLRFHLATRRVVSRIRIAAGFNRPRVESLSFGGGFAWLTWWVEEDDCRPGDRAGSDLRCYYLSRVDSATNAATGVFPLPFGSVHARDSALWVHDDSALLRFDPVTGARTARIALRGLLAMTLADDGPWVTLRTDAGDELRRVDPQTNALDPRRIPLTEAGLVQPAAGAGAVWAIDRGRGALVRADFAP